ncbi:MAG: tetratricopeptide repeat protein [Anaerolineales bacterium]|jgi:hypothetical protein
MENRRPPIYLITGLIIGLVLGVVYVWLLTPVETIETQPEDLRADFKDAYRELIARAYLANNDLDRAETRLALLGDEDPARALSVQAQLTLSQENGDQAARALGLLAAALQGSGGAPIYADSPTRAPTGDDPEPSATPEGGSGQTTETPEPSGSSAATPTSGSVDDREETPETGETTPTITPTNTPTPTATQGPPFVLSDFGLECDPAIDPPLIKVNVFDGAGNPVPGVAILVSWDTNTNRFITGLKPEYGLGYADFEMDPAVTYSLRLEVGGDPVNSITVQQCENADEPYWGSWQFNFAQP